MAGSVITRETLAHQEEVVVLTERVRKLRETYLEAKPQICAERSRLFTQYWRQSEGEPIAIRRAKALKKILEEMSIVIRDGELIVGNQTKYVRGCSVYPEVASHWVIDELQKAQIFASGDAIQGAISDEERRMVIEDCQYWQDKSLWEKACQMFEKMWGSRVADAIEGGVFWDTVCRLQGRHSVDYARAISQGLNGIIQEAKEKLAGHQIVNHEDLRKSYFWQAVIIVCEALIEFAHRHAHLAREMAAREKDPQRKRELERIAETCEWVPANPARNFYEAVQSLWWVQVALWIENAASGYSPGRMDQYLYPFYKKDLEEGRLTQNEAAELLGCLWVKFSEIDVFRDERGRKGTQGTVAQNVTIGGVTTEGKDATNELSYLLLDVTRQMKLTQPTLSLRYHDGLPEDFLLKAAEVNRDYGGGMPAWFNDKVALVSFPQMGVPLEEARNWVPIGCVERGLSGSSPLTMSYGYLNMAKCFELALTNGMDRRMQKQIGPQTGDPRSFLSYEALYEAIERQIAYAVETQVDSYNIAYSMHADLIQIPFHSTLMNDCIQKGKDITEGGGRWRNLVMVAPHGFVNTANSLAAIKKLVFEEKTVSMKELLEALDVDFEGKDSLLQTLLNTPKFGNDDDYVDYIMNDLFQTTLEIIPKHTHVWGEPVAVGWNGITVHYYFGKFVGALPDGRKAWEPTGDGALSAFRGTDKKGPTAVIRSAAKVDSIKGQCTLLNLKFHPASLQGRDGLRKLVALVKTYFDLYGYHLQFNMLNRETLLQAKKHPEKFRDLIVRVAGFSAFFVELAPEVQDEIIARTEHSF